MKKIIVLSDSHGNIKGVDALRDRIAENDYVIFLGDGWADMRNIFLEFSEKLYFCGGNCDFFSALPGEGMLEIEGLKIFYCHGHQYGVKSGLDNLEEEARKRGADIALYGHTHCALITEKEGLIMINPGSYKRSVGEGGSYCYLVIHGRKATPVLVGESVF